MAKEESRKTTASKAATSKKAAKKKTAKKAAKKTTAKKAAPKKKAVKKTAVKKSPAATRAGGRSMSADEKRMMVAVHAYYKWEKAGFPTGQDFQHWIDAEREVNAMLKG